MGHYGRAKSGGVLPNVEGILKFDVGVDVAVEVELALLDELHDAGPREEFRHRAGTKEVFPGETGISFRNRSTVALAKSGLPSFTTAINRAGDNWPVRSAEALDHRGMFEIDRSEFGSPCDGLRLDA